jgi:hypothetical protein
MESTTNISQAFNNNPQGSRLRGRPKHKLWNCIQTDINTCKIKNWKGRSRNRADWEKFIREPKGCIGLITIWHKYSAPLMILRGHHKPKLS